ncbi:RNA-dependent ATPase [Coemansia sp. Benny D115]|nr:RNA-dependent ATPase [Coemansia sp. Benny D115]
MPHTSVTAAPSAEKSSKHSKSKSSKSEKRKQSSESSKHDAPSKKSKSAPASNDSTPAPPVTLQEAKEFYEKHNISVSGDEPFLPFLSFDQAPFSKDILKACKKFTTPTPIQSACWPVITSGRDTVGIAETGSGKTFAFALPAMHYLQNKYGSSAKKCAKPLVLVISPTRELAMQTNEQCVEAGEGLGYKSVCVYGGASKYGQINEIKSTKPAVVVATPGRLVDLVENDQVLDLSDVTFVVFDEADRMLDQGFEREIKKIMGFMGENPDRQTVMFSATWPTSVRNLAKSFSKNAVHVSIGADELTINMRVEQIVEVIDYEKKEGRLLDLLRKYHSSRKNRVIVFALYKNEADRLERVLSSKGYNCVAINGNKAQNKRTKAIEDFRSGAVPLLIATDVAARGLDVPDVEYVINYEFPLTIDEYTHRCGRTARAGKTGVAHTLFTVRDKAHSGELVNVLRAANMKIPDNLMKFGTTVKKKPHAAYGAFFKEIDESVKPTKIIFD